MQLPAEAWSLIGGIVGAVLGSAATLFSAYWGPRKLEEWREGRAEEKVNGPRKRLLASMLEDPRFQDGRKLETLCRVTGTSTDECRRLLVEIGARGVLLSGALEGWALIARKPLDEQ